jgi:hypothetical protein
MGGLPEPTPSRGQELDELVTALLTAARALVGVSARSMSVSSSMTRASSPTVMVTVA